MSGRDAPLLGRDDSPSRHAATAAVRELYPAAGSGCDDNPPDPGQYFPYTTSRYPPATITQNLQNYGVFDDITTSLNQSRWGAFNTNGYQDFSIQAHDGGHVSVGPTMADQNISSYDPVFWFYHCNIDRLWLQWQQNVQATTLAGFKSTVDGDASWLSAPFNALPPFTTTTADETISFGISYEPEGPEVALENKVGSVNAAKMFSIQSSAPVSVWVKNIDRLNIRDRSSSRCWPTASRSQSVPSSSRIRRRIARTAGSMR